MRAYEPRPGVVSLCARCKQPIVRVKMIAGRKIDLDAAPSDRGTVVMVTGSDCENYDRRLHEEWLRYRVHTCPPRRQLSIEGLARR